MPPTAPPDDTIVDASYTAETAAAVPALVVGRYQIVRWIGSGGMGRVYEAIDTELGERVALKMLREVTGGPDNETLERFRREVKLTRRIQHPNVARMFDIGEIDGDRYLTMELVDGESLANQIGERMPWPQLQQVAIQLCRGLAAAHEKAVIHRDLKPDNVLVEHATGRVVITDFGIARSSEDAIVTQAGAIVGTPRYMAPEQLAGSATDARADLFSLGVMLYELGSAERPWDGDNAVAIAVAQAMQPMRPLDPHGLPLAFVEVVESLLAIDRDRRPASAAAVGAALAAISSEPVERDDGPAAKLAPRAHEVATTIAVLPFIASPGDDYIADSMRDDMIDLLSTTPGLHVRPAGAIGTRGIDPREAGIQLGIDHVVVGSVRRTPNGLRVAARLVSVADGFQIWAHRIDGTDAQVLEIGDQLGGAIATALSTRAAQRHAPPTDPKAVELYLRARMEIKRFWGDHALTATQLLEQANALAPTSAPIAGALAVAAVSSWARLGQAELLVKARRYIERGLALDHPDAFLAASQLHWNQGDVEACARDIRHALNHAPMSALAHEAAGKLLIEIDRSDAARSHFTTSLALDPTRLPMLSAELIRMDLLAGDVQQAEHRVALLRADPDPSIAIYANLLALRIAGWQGDAARMQILIDGMEPTVPSGSALFANLLERWRFGRLDKAFWDSMLADLARSDRPKRMPLAFLQRAIEIAAMIEEPSYALDALECAVDHGLVDSVWLEGFPLFASMTAPRWHALREEVEARARRVLAIFRGTPPATPSRGDRQ